MALITTWWGLIVAIPALSVHGIIKNRIDGLTAEIALEAEELLLAIAPTTSDSTEQES